MNRISYENSTNKELEDEIKKSNDKINILNEGIKEIKKVTEKRDYGVGSRDNSRLDNLKKEPTSQQSQVANATLNFESMESEIKIMRLLDKLDDDGLKDVYYNVMYRLNPDTKHTFVK